MYVHIKCCNVKEISQVAARSQLEPSFLFTIAPTKLPGKAALKASLLLVSQSACSPDKSQFSVLFCPVGHFAFVS